MRTANSERMRGDGDAERNHIYADAFTKDRDFFAFYRSMQAYEEALKGGHTRIVLSPNSEFFRYFNGGAPKPEDGVKAPPAQPSGSSAAASTPAGALIDRAQSKIVNLCLLSAIE